MPDAGQPQRRSVTIAAALMFGLALLALLTPVSRAEFPPTRVGALMAVAAVVEMLHALRRSSARERRHATISGVISMVMALLLINAPFVASRALRVFLAGWFGIDAVRNAVAALRESDRRERWLALLAFSRNTAVVLVLVFAGEWALTWAVAIAGAIRIGGIAWNIMLAPVHETSEADETVVEELGLADEPAAAAVAAEIETEEAARSPIDRGWTLSFIATLFAIHIGRMSTDVTLLGLVAPGVAVLGDLAIAVLITLLVINPLYLLWRKPTRWIERRAWRRQLKRDRARKAALPSRLTQGWLRWRLRSAIRMRVARYSLLAALNQGLQTGLPFAAIVAATVPVWGMSWYFDTENWAAGMWNSWAASRTDTWRETMVRAVLKSDGGRSGTAIFAVQPAGVGTGDFSFVVIGDPGEGDASQHVLRDQLLSVANSADVRFVVISSDVVYPTGAMKDYEAKFWLPFKGVTRPVFAIPGNHDWYDALEGFNATFLEEGAARASIHARVEADKRLTSTTDDRVDELIKEAARLRTAYGIPTGFQRAPFFELQTDRFALIAVDSGILRTLDAAQSAWLDTALDRASGKLTMAILGHPFFAGGGDVAFGDDDFMRLKRRLIDRGVTILMAGDTHDLEYYVESDRTAGTVHHFVNGGGGAYLSFGTALAWPSRPPTTTWAYYPARESVTAKIQARTPWWKRPAWWWTREFGAWPFTAEWLSAAFDYNVAPFFQSFVEVKVEPSANRVRVIPYGVHGRLTWDELAYSEGQRPSSGSRYVEWVMPMPSTQ